MKNIGTFGPGARAHNPTILVKRSTMTARHLRSREDFAVVSHHSDRPVSHEKTWIDAMGKAKDLARRDGHTYRVESFTGTWLVGDEGITPDAPRKDNPAVLICQHPGCYRRAVEGGACAAHRSPNPVLEDRDDDEREDDGMRRAPVGQMSLLSAEERRENPTSDYEELVDVARGGRWGNPSGALSLEDMPDVDLSGEEPETWEDRLGNPSCGCQHQGAAMPSLAEVSRRCNPDLSPGSPSWEDNEAREDASALGLPPDHVAVAAIGTADEHLMHEALEVLDGMRPLASKAKAHLIDHLVRYFEARGGKLHRHAPGGAYEPMARAPNPVDTALLLSPGMSRAWRVRNVALPADVKTALSEIVTEETPGLAALDLAAAEGAVSLSQIDAGLVDIEHARKRHRPNSKAGVLIAAVKKDLMSVRARPYLYLMQHNAHLGYDLRSYPVKESEIII